eukprot:TRINITY_DN68692_c0_g1_i1.p1 TRINITY_DN68692_c0_g1~~TRINITY_DN68692_c0_g1_i1.p1  ORF type:complete len:345 (-),score=60.97 TRINITY_DN68692_c0_g1_i1:37-969(-)
MDRFHHKLGLEAQSTSHFEHFFLAVHAEAVPALLPYDLSLDESCPWTSHRAFMQRAAALFRDHVLYLPDVLLQSSRYSEQREPSCLSEFASASQALRTYAAPGAQNCFPGPLQTFAQLPDGQPFLWAWGQGARRKTSPSGASMDYTRASFAGLEPCLDEDELVERALQQESVAWWCKGCTVSRAFSELQERTASLPTSVQFWNELGVWVSWLSRQGNLVTAAACFAIAQRLQLGTAVLPHPQVEKNAKTTRGLLQHQGIYLDEDTLWEQDGQVLQQVIKSALRSDKKGPYMEAFNDVQIQRFSAYLIAGR